LSSRRFHPPSRTGRFDFAVGLNLPLTPKAALQTLAWVKSALVLVGKAGNPSHVNPDDLCSSSVIFGETVGSVNLEADHEIAGNCAKAGKPSPKVLTFQDVATRNQALVNGHTTAMTDDPAVIKYESEKQHVPVAVLPGGHLDLTGAKPIALGWLFKKGDTAMEKPVTQAIAALIKDGTWQRILKQGGVADSIIPPRFIAAG
jgi:polar amino acid transport system substrate-binding protein